MLQSQSVDEAQLDPLQGMDRLGPLDASPRSQGQQSRPRPSSVDDESRSDSGLGIPQVAVGVITLALAAAFVVTSGALPGGGGSSSGPVSYSSCCLASTYAVQISSALLARLMRWRYLPLLERLLC